MKKNPGVQVEVCAYSFISCLAAERAGANRVELCASPWEGGTTPSGGLVSQVLSQTNIEVHAMLRPRGGDFCYDLFEKDTMEAEAMGSGSNSAKSSGNRLPSSVLTVFMATSAGSAGTSAWSLASSSAMSQPMRSPRVLSIWPSLIYVVPSADTAMRMRVTRDWSVSRSPSLFLKNFFGSSKPVNASQSASPYFARMPPTSPTRRAWRPSRGRRL